MTADGPSPRAIARVFFVVVSLALLLYLVWLARDTLKLLMIGGFLALALGPAVNVVARKGRMPRALSILIVYLLGFLSIVGIGLVIVPPIVDGVGTISADLPGEIDKLRDTGWVRDLDDRYDVVQRLRDEAQNLPSRLGDAVGTLQAVTVGAASAALQLFSVLVIGFLLLLDGPRMVRWGLDQLPELSRSRYEAIADDVYNVIGGYVAGNLMISIIAGTSTYVVLTLLDVPFAAPLAILMAFLDLIPLIGATIAGFVIGLATLLGSFPADLIVWAIFFFIYQQVENNLLQPIIYKRTVDVHPLIVIVGVLIGGGMLGVLGALLAIPIAAALQVVIRDWWSYRKSPVVLPSGSLA